MKFELQLLQDVLSGYCQLQSVSLDAHNDIVVTASSTVSCFAMDGAFSRQFGLRSTEVFDWAVILPETVSGVAGTGSRLANLVDSGGNTIFALGTIKELQEYHHWNGTRQFFVAGVSRK